jgi:hypothetical protein
VDESVIGYQPGSTAKKEAESRGEPIPVVYIPRKPHPNGLEIFLVATSVEHPARQNKGLPFIVDMRPHLTQGDSNPQETFEFFMKRWLHSNKPHWIGDAAFGSFDLLEKVEQWNGKATFSMSTNNSSWIWELLSLNVPPQHWRAAINSKGWIASSHTLVDSNRSTTHQQILSNGFEASFTTNSSNNNNLVSETQSSMPIFTKETLVQMKVDQLKEICRKYNIKQGKNKASLIDNIVARSTTLHQNINELTVLKQKICSTWLPDPPPLHDFYRSWFNLVDLADRKWYSVENHHQQQNWKAKMIHAILRFAVLNAWVYSTTSNFMKWKEWRKQAAMGFMNYHTQ